MDNTIIEQGSFTSLGSNATIILRSDVDWMMVYNTTQAAASQTTAVGVKYYWQRGFPALAKWTTFKSNAANAANLEQYLTTNGFSLVDSSNVANGSINATITAISAAAIPVVSNSGTNGLVAGNVVRLYNVAGAQQVGGMDFTVGQNTLTTGTFSLDYMAQIVAGTTGSWRLINSSALFYPSRRHITAITQAANAVVTMSVQHAYTVGQEVRIVVPAAFGMVEINNLVGTILAVSVTSTTNSITVNINSTGFTAFAFPLSAATPFSPAEVIPVGEDSAEAAALGVDPLGDSTVNTGYIGMVLTGGVNNPGGATSDVMYWVAGKSFSVN